MPGLRLLLHQVIDRVALVSLDDDVTDAAIALRSGLCTLDALHLATALRLGDAVDGILTFDAELAAAAADAGIPSIEVCDAADPTPRRA